jgi:osmotically-inducible protein OsmY
MSTIFSPIRVARMLSVCIAVATVAGRAEAQDASARDLSRELQVLHALHNDPKLAPLNLGVKVRDRVAILWGPVPTRELAERAIFVVKKLPEIGEVQNQMMVQYRDETVYPPMRLVPGPAPRGGPPKSDAKPQLQPEQLRPPMVDLVWQPVNPEAAPKPSPPSPPPSVAFLPSGTSQPGLTGTVSRPRDSMLTEAPDAAAISSAVQSLIQTEERFRRVRYEVKQGQVFLGGVVNRWADLRELAVAVTHIPGVEGVVLREVRAEPRK